MTLRFSLKSLPHLLAVAVLFSVNALTHAGTITQHSIESTLMSRTLVYSLCTPHADCDAGRSEFLVG